MGITKIPGWLAVSLGPKPHLRGLRLLLPVIAVLASAGPAAPTERMPMPPLAAVERGAYRVRDIQTGRDLWKEEWLLNRETREGHPILHLQENGEGIRDNPAPTVWTDRMSLDLWGPHPVLTSIREVRDADGRPVHVEQREFDYELGSGQLVSRDFEMGDTKLRSVSLTAQAIPTELLPEILRLLPEIKDHQMQFDLVTGEGRLVGMRATVVGHEWVKVPAGTFECFKVELQPTGRFRFLATFTSKLFMWQTVTAPHFWVKYQGPAGGLGFRQIVRELVRFEAQVAEAALPQAMPGGKPTQGLASSFSPVDSPDGRRSDILGILGYLFVLAAVVFEIGVESVRHLMGAL